MKVGLQFGVRRDEGTRDEREIMSYFEKYLRQSGVEIVTLEEGVSDLSGIDLIHLFGMADETYRLSREACNRGTPVVVSPFYWNESFPIHYDLKSLKTCGQPELHEKKLTAHYFRKKMESDRNRQEKFILNNASLVLASGRCERLQVVRDYELDEKSVAVFPVGIDLFMGVGKPDPFIEKFGVKDFVLCVGQLTPRKNQHLLIDITRDLDLPLVIIGPMNEESEYTTHCRDISHSDVHILGTVEPQMLKSAYQAAKMFALPSAFELPGMAYMSAAVAGLPIVATNRGTSYDYLQNQVNYCDPEDTVSVFDAVSTSWSSSHSDQLKKNLLDKFSWGKTSVMLVKIYQRIIKVAESKA